MPKTRGSVQIKEDPDAVPRKIAKKPKDQTDDADREKIVELLNDAATEPEASRLLDFLSEIQERIVFKDSYASEESGCRRKLLRSVPLVTCGQWCKVFK